MTYPRLDAKYELELHSRVFPSAHSCDIAPLPYYNRMSARMVCPGHVGILDYATSTLESCIVLCMYVGK